MGAQEAFLEVGRASLADDMDGNARGVAADDGVGAGDLFDPFHERLFGPRLLDDHLDNPVALGDGGVEVIFQVAHADEAGCALGEEVGRVRLDHAVVAALDDAVAHLAVGQLEAGRLFLWGQLGRDDVQQRRRDAGVGQVPGDGCAHGPRPDDGGVVDSVRHAVYAPYEQIGYWGSKVIPKQARWVAPTAASSLARVCFGRVVAGLMGEGRGARGGQWPPLAPRPSPLLATDHGQIERRLGLRSETWSAGRRGAGRSATRPDS